VLSFNERGGGSRLDAELTYYNHMFSSLSMHKMAEMYVKTVEVLSLKECNTMKDLKMKVMLN